MATPPCPRCSKPLSAVMLHGIEADLCRACEGLWFDKDELGKTLDSSAALRSKELAASWTGKARPEETPGASAIACPRCRVEMTRYRFAVSSPVLIDGCPKGCGVWLDDGEIGTLTDYLAEHMKPATPAERDLFKTQRAALEKARADRETLLIDGLTTLDDRPGLTGLIGGLIQSAYAALWKSGLR